MILTPSSNPFNVNHGAFSIPLARYCRELEDVIAVAKSKGYKLPTHFQLKIISNLINELKSNGIFSRYDVIYITGLNSLHSRPNNYPNVGIVSDVLFMDTIADFTTLNIKNPLLFQLIRYSGTRALPYYSDIGWNNRFGLASGGQSGYFDTQWIPGTHGVNWTRNDAGASCYIGKDLYSTSGNTMMMGTRDTINSRIALHFIPQNGTNFQGNINTASTIANFNNTLGFNESTFRLQRTGASALSVYKDAVQLGSTSTAGSQTVIGTTSVYLLGRNSDGAIDSVISPGTNPISIVALGGSLSLTQVKTESEIFKSFVTSLNYK